MSSLVKNAPCNIVDFALPLRLNVRPDPEPLHKKLQFRVRPTISLSNRLRAVAELSSESRTGQDPPSVPVAAGSLVLVAGATGGVGQLLTGRLLDEGYRVRAICRDVIKAQSLFDKSTANLEIMECDFRDEKRVSVVLENVDVVCSCIGTTAFPSSRWDGDNAPENTDKIAIGNLLKHTSHQVQRFILVSSIGVTRTNQLPYSILNLFKVLTYKRMSEESLIASGLPWTIIRPCRLTDGPYTSYDLNTLIKGTRGMRTSVQVSEEDDLSGEASRISVAEAIVQCLHLPSTLNHAYSLASVEEGIPPEQDTNKWSSLFDSANQ